ncbi:MAG TPA: nucleoside triphosphate pyrophosphohydrolase [Ilumatobacteraceae bacterium]|nr:nucleoside triphosphate pyrophosphohydrolase [Ilumatobacteraceae bacterium]
MTRGELPRIIVVGLGPGGHDHVTAETRNEIERATHRYLRTSVHPSADLVTGATTFDHLYDTADTFDDVYTQIADELIAAARDVGEILYAVPGSPLVLERTVRHLLASGDVTCDLRPAMSFLDVAWARLGVDPIEAGVRLVDGHEFATAAAGERGPLLVAHTHANWVLSEIKLAVDEAVGDEPVTILHALGTTDERMVDTTWAELDRTIEADHLTSVWIPHLAAPVGGAYVRFHELTRTLREQCPWDIEQTHASLIPHLLEETYEVVDAIQALDADPSIDADPDTDLIEELGDLLYQIEFHATIAEQEGRFTITDVANGIHDKLVRRHPHVFGDLMGADLGTTEVLSNWDDIKRHEKSRTSVFDGIPRSMPALAYAAKVGSKASKVGFDWPDVDGAFSKIAEETVELHEAMNEARHEPSGADAATTDELGDLLFAIVNVARHLDIDPELALRAATDKFRTRFEGVERLARERSIDLRSAELVTLDGLWDEVKSGR